MDKNTIEEKDLDVVKQLRSIYRKREIPAPPKKKFWKVSGAWLTVLCCGSIVLGMIVFKQRSTTAVQDMPAQKQEVVVSHTEVPIESSAPMTLVDAKKVTTETGTHGPEETASSDDVANAEPIPPESAEVETIEVETQPIDVATMNIEAQSNSSGAEFTASEKTTADRSQPATEPPVDPVSAEQRNMSGDVQISQLVTCGDVRDKQYAFEKSTFSVSADPVAMVWMRVLSETPPFTLKHVYSLNGEHYCDVSLTIRYPHMRTWSKVTIDRDIHIGKWHVDVVDENKEILDQIEFTVEP